MSLFSCCICRFFLSASSLSGSIIEMSFCDVLSSFVRSLLSIAIDLSPIVSETKNPGFVLLTRHVKVNKVPLRNVRRTFTLCKELSENKSKTTNSDRKGI